MIWLLPHPSPPLVSNFDRRHAGRQKKRDNLLTGEGGVGGRGANSCDGDKAWSSINLSISLPYGIQPDFAFEYVAQQTIASIKV